MRHSCLSEKVMEPDLSYRVAVLEREVARLTLLVEKMLAEKSNPSGPMVCNPNSGQQGKLSFIYFTQLGSLGKTDSSPYRP